jgi:(2R)-sulfolactate sulfo-lyase subunit alpha
VTTRLIEPGRARFEKHHMLANRRQTMGQIADELDARTQAPPTAPAFLAHTEGDMVAVAVQDVAPGERTVVYMDSDREARIEVTEAIPLGHKVALMDLAEGLEVIEYGVRVALTRQPINMGQLVHVHNVRSARWQNSI